MTHPADDILPDAPNGEVVHWMDPGPWRLGASGAPLTSVGAFALGVATAVAAILLYRYLEPRREALPPWRWGRGVLH